ncbi:MAG: hypothetical protein CFE23_10620 [Flavobacterium sp. BFFFF1]|uniref:T9SS type B sorting domain-containing protein n=1 Tax=Flavobacterium sp. BFFFF1 TaxID=2015557 RepID=UPI000BD10240|nr:gliding motility-associated C-terminal domain-containing protein [Flavobacterium sp. BFFFF1]OYU80166.1 MAG: hypothetical protein CFE23_10620 [Flavobacterium sp. BFFFF1]
MKLRLRHLYGLAIVLLCCAVRAQNISLYHQYNGRYDFTFFGNTLNTQENNNVDGEPAPPCNILTSSAADLNLAPDDVIQSAYLYWAGSGTGDFDVSLNGQAITAQRTFSITNSAGFPCFSAFADITNLVTATGNANYDFTGLDLTAIIDPYCPSGGNFGGWAVIVVYENAALPLNQLNIYDGMQAVPSVINITLDSLNVIDDQDAKIGFLAWEGDKNISMNESLRINGNLLSNALNPASNAFNGTNSFTNSSELYNMDLDVYTIEGNINIGDTSALIQLTSSQDFVMINAIVTKLNSQLPDAVIAINNVEKSCNSRFITVDYTVSNPNSTDPLPPNTKIAVFADGIFVGSATTVNELPINGSENGTITVELPENIPIDFTLELVIDSDELGVGSITEINENNNSDALPVTLDVSPPFNPLPDLISCNERLGRGTFDFTSYVDLVKVNPDYTAAFFSTQEDAESNINEITSPENYVTVAPDQVFVRISDGICHSVAAFNLLTRNCPPKVYNLVEPFPNDFYDTFLIDGLRDIFLKFQLSIYNRWGKLVWTGNNNTEDWNGTATEGLRMFGSDLPSGTYFYILELNDPDYPQPLTGFVYLKK